MKLEYTSLNGLKCQLSAQVTVDHPTSSYGLPVLVTNEGPVDIMSWMLLNYRVVEATEKEIKQLKDWIRSIPTAAML